MWRGIRINFYQKVVTILYVTSPHVINIEKMRIVNCADAKICHFHFSFLDLGDKEVLNFPSILCKIVVHRWVTPKAPKVCHSGTYSYTRVMRG